MPTRATGRTERTTVADETVEAFVPAPLPPTDPPLTMDRDRVERLQAAEAAVARLDLVGEIIPSLDWFLYAFVRKEAVVSSQIEGTQATLVDLLAFEASAEGPATNPDIEEVCNYLEALNHARAELADPHGLPLSMRLLNEAHARSLQGTRGAEKMPGEIRRSQNWVGGHRPGLASFVPPPPQLLGELLSDLEKYLHADHTLPPLVRAGLIHVQFETIHPYLDGNGRIGRLLIGLLLEHWGLLRHPLLYLSSYFKRHRSAYYARLSAVRTEGDWEGWTDYFLEGVATVADEAVDSARALFALVSEDRRRLMEAGNTTMAAVRLFELLPRHPIVSVAFAVERLEVSKPTAGRAVEALESAGILVEMTGKKRDRTWAYGRYLDELRVGTGLDGAEFG